ncbi:MAG: endonuclease domain-containing protein [Patescibacteria group bacterium]
MTNLYSNKSVKERRRALRNEPTDAERKMWHMLRGKRVNGKRFLRQYSAGKYILDFYCPELRLAIEIDGSQHIDSPHDDKRTEFLGKLNIFVLRFWNNDVLKNPDGVYKKLLTEITKKQ